MAEGERSLRIGSRTLTPPSPSSINPHAMVCRRWRGQPGLVLVAVPLIAEVRVDGTSGDLDVLIIDEARGTAANGFAFPTPWMTTPFGYLPCRLTPPLTGSARIGSLSALNVTGPEVRAPIPFLKRHCLSTRCAMVQSRPSLRIWLSIVVSGNGICPAPETPSRQSDF